MHDIDPEPRVPHDYVFQQQWIAQLHPVSRCEECATGKIDAWWRQTDVVGHRDVEFLSEREVGLELRIIGRHSPELRENFTHRRHGAGFIVSPQLFQIRPTLLIEWKGKLRRS